MYPQVFIITRWPAATAVQAFRPPSGGGPGLKLDLLVVRLRTRSARPKTPPPRPPRSSSSAPGSWWPPPPPSSKSLSLSGTPGTACVLESRVATRRSAAGCFSEPSCRGSSVLVDRSRSSVLPLLVDWERAIVDERPRPGFSQVMMPSHDWGLPRWELERLALPKFPNELEQSRSRRELQIRRCQNCILVLKLAVDSWF